MQEKRPLVLMIDDDRVVLRGLSATLFNNGYEVLEADTGQTGLAQAAAHLPQVIILDLGLPDMNGTEVAAALRQWTTIPIIVLSAAGQEDDKVRALDAGADDYLTKPFGVQELLARIRVALRHAERMREPAGVPVFACPGLSLDFARRLVQVDEQPIRLTPTEYKLLAALVQHAGQVVTHRQLLHDVWGPEYGSEINYLHIYVRQLRHKLSDLANAPRFIRSEPGVGYRFIIEV